MSIFLNTCREPYGLTMSVQLTDWQIFFILAHEMAHIILGHLEIGQTQKIELSQSDITVDIFTCSQQKEYEADILAFTIFLVVYDHLEQNQMRTEAVMPTETWLAAPITLFAYFSYRETLAWKPGTAYKSSHPRSNDRVQYLINQFRKRFEESLPAGMMIGFTQHMIISASYLILDERGIARPESIPPDVEFWGSLGQRID